MSAEKTPKMPSPETPPRTKKKPRKILLSLLIVVCFFVAATMVMIMMGTADYSYSDEQLETIEEMGNPDAFKISFSSNEEGDEERMEEWFYHDRGLIISFLNGVSFMLEELEPLPENAIPVFYEPKEFTPYMKWESVLFDIDDKPAVKASDYYPELFDGTGVDLYYSEQIVVGVDSDTGRLVYVETMVLVPEEEGAEQ